MTRCTMWLCYYKQMLNRLKIQILLTHHLHTLRSAACRLGVERPIDPRHWYGEAYVLGGQNAVVRASAENVLFLEGLTALSHIIL